MVLKRHVKLANSLKDNTQSYNTKKVECSLLYFFALYDCFMFTARQGFYIYAIIVYVWILKR